MQVQHSKPSIFNPLPVQFLQKRWNKLSPASSWTKSSGCQMIKKGLKSCPRRLSGETSRDALVTWCAATDLGDLAWQDFDAPDDVLTTLW